ncbi:MAG: ATP-dependent DNA helicase, partial [Polyangiaceae bacterium]|nr:ATP-dependent DNA helicase [Polyangiaceae bacterium]
MGDARRILGASGPFATQIDSYQSRVGQLEVADAVERIMSDDGVLLCEAGTGIGKTFAYLVPALLSGRKVVISTATKALQDQIAERDLPLVQSILQTDVRVAVMKGLGNYLCRRRYREFFLSPEALDQNFSRDLEEVKKFAESTQSGELVELRRIRESAPILTRVNSSSETRIGAQCPYFNDCWVTKMKQAAEAAQIVIVNHHLFFADLSLRGPHPGRVLPDYDAVILDEAHQVEDTAALFFGLRLSESQIDRLVRDSGRLLNRVRRGSAAEKKAGVSPVVELARQAKERLFDALRKAFPPGRHVLNREHFLGGHKASWENLLAQLDALGQTARAWQRDVEESDERESLEQLYRRAAQAEEGFRGIIDGQEGRVTWLENISGKLSLSSTPVDMSLLLRDRLFDDIPAVALVSATLSTSERRASDQAAKKKNGLPGFRFVRARLGVEEPALELQVDSPFSYQEHCLLYTPQDLPEPRDPQYLEAAAERAWQLIDAADGGAFVLTTSHQAMRFFHSYLESKVPRGDLFCQGEAPKDQLLNQFRATTSSTLV